jgi:hypothetical protein
VMVPERVASWVCDQAHIAGKTSDRTKSMHALEFKKRTKAPRSLTRQEVKSKPSRRGSNKHSEYFAIEYVLSRQENLAIGCT